MTALETSNRLSDWPVERTVYLTLDFECDYGTAIDKNSYEAARQVSKLVDLLDEFDVPLTCFLQTELLTEAPNAVRDLENADVPVEFHPHSHSHPKRDKANMPVEVQRSVEAVSGRYGTEPLGYRFPDGAATPENYRLLDDHDVTFSASVFPSYRPGRFNNMSAPQYPFTHSDADIVELPFTVYSKWVRVPVALSYLKLIGKPFQQLVMTRPPSVIVFDMHMHDVVTPSTISELPRPYQLIYGRHRDGGMALLCDLVSSLGEHGYRFSLMSDLYERTRRALHGQEPDESAHQSKARGTHIR